MHEVPELIAEDDVLARSGWFRHWFGDKARFWWLAACVLGVVAALKGLRMPGAWALTQAQLDYSHGFIKRGLPGAVYGALGILHRVPLSVAFFVELAGLFGLLVWFTRRSGMVQRCGTPAVVAMFAGSYVVTYLCHIVGYFDIPNAAIAVGLLLIRSPKTRFVVASPLFVVALLIHENFLFLFAPVVLFSFFLNGVAEPAGRRQVWGYGVALMLLAGAVTLGTSLKAPMGDDQIDAMQNYVEARADFDVRDDFFQVLGVPLKDNMAQVRKYGWHRYLWWTYQAVALCVLLPMLLLLMRLCLRLVRGSAVVSERRWIVTALALAVFSPLVMHALGLDQVRWNTWVVANAYLALGLLCMHLPGPALRMSVAERNAIVLVIALGMASGHGLFDGEKVNPYPFFPKALWGAIQRHDGALPGF